MPDDGDSTFSGDDEPEYDVERILAQRTKNGRTHYLVKWDGFPDEECSWEPREHFMDQATLVEWQRQYAEGDYLNEAEIAALEVKMKQWSERQRAQDEDILPGSPELSLPSDSSNSENLPESPPCSHPIPETQSPRVPSLPLKARSTSENRRKSSFGSREPPAKRPKVKEPTRSDVQTETHISSANNSLSRIPSFGPKKGLATKLPIQSASASTHAVTSLQHRTGERYKNLRHMNNAMKFARRERTPDIRELDLRAPGDFAMPRSIQEVQEQDASSSKREESPLFVPETIPEAPPEVGTESHFLPARSPSPADGPQAEEKSKALPPTSMSGAKSPPRGRLKESAHARQGVSQPSSPTRQPIRSTQTSRVGSRPREPSKERPIVATRPQAANSSLASIARRDDFTPSRKPSELSEGNVGASRISVPTSASGRPIYESFKERPLGQPGQLFTARNGRSWYWGEVCVLLRYGAHQVGHVKILGFPGWLITRLISTKQGRPDLEIHFEERNVMSQVKFSAFASQLAGEIGLGTIQPYQDIASAAASLAAHLESNDIAGVWEFPQPTIPGFVMVLYSSNAPSWKHFGTKRNPESEERLHLVARNMTQDLRLAQWVSQYEASSHHTAWESDFSGPRQGTLTSSTSESPNLTLRQTTLISDAPELERPVSLQQILPPVATDAASLAAGQMGLFVDSPSEIPTVRTKPSFASMQSPRSPKSPRLLSSPRKPRDFEDEGFLQKDQPAALTFSASFRDLMNFGDRERKRPAFYIAFGKSRPLEAAAVKNWLLVHNIRDESWTGNAITRVFIRGTGLFITENTLIDYPDEVLRAVKWFQQQSKGKAKTYKLGLVPDASEWLLKRVLECDEAVRDKYIGILEVVSQLESQGWFDWNSATKGDPDRWLVDDGPGEDYRFILPIPSDLPGYESLTSASRMEASRVEARDKILIQYFVGWAALRVETYKNFYVLDEERTCDTVKHSCHVYFRKRAKFVEMIEQMIERHERHVAAKKG
ncbi:hypothetical protein LTR99_005685 [Exophiala xenobiotica]|uniref:Chromo domain-containing protein n=1 Tax=Vermiconidia calcicola TaxID=1690605 RepID=A0AAV9QGZ2_9PEZI|nr:hypothetical protein LTR99_005685 [Exophiala xenobiotica]KAK5430922.1 hypothetical protein LTR34_005481 [Exophiala xenobiotica]KAK5540311.1 hypothetical protein LTR23_006408 [Chaetothyriales sp. CCFEE 6169]KAK5541241.1 hypothetical protein LTR25_003018 [Vermiconidia calcicola]